MTIQLNGKEHPLGEAISITGLLHSIGLEGKPVIVELNKKALFPREYCGVMLSSGDQVEVITIAAGG